MPLRESTLKQEGPLQASKALKIALLLDKEEMRAFLEHLQQTHGLYLLLTHAPLTPQEYLLSMDLFLEKYGLYIDHLKAGEEPLQPSLRPFLAPLLTTSLDILYAMPVKEQSSLVKATRPIIQMQPHSIYYSEADGQVRSLVFGQETIPWGIQLSYPQLFQDPKTHDISHVHDPLQFPNTPLFKTVQKWVRYHTLPTSFESGGKTVNTALRIGEQCLAWAQNIRGLNLNIIRP